MVRTAAGFRGLENTDIAANSLGLINNSLHKGDTAKAMKILNDLSILMYERFAARQYSLLGYETKSNRGIWHLKYNQYYPGHVNYTCPNNYLGTPGAYRIGAEDWWSAGSFSYLFAMMCRELSP